MRNKSFETATFGGGCFWCTEAIFQRLRGVEKVESGYSGGEDDNPSYDDVSTGDTGHAEVVQIVFDPSVISYKDLLSVFFATHDPTTLNKQGNDVGTQYRSVILYHSMQQKEEAETYIEKYEKNSGDKVVTDVKKFEMFYQSEGYHKNYYNRNVNINPYCSIVISPKLKKLTEKFSDKLKD